MGYHSRQTNSSTAYLNAPRLTEPRACSALWSVLHCHIPTKYKISQVLDSAHLVTFPVDFQILSLNYVQYF